MMASLLSNLGVVAEYDGDYELARSLNEQALELRVEIGDRRAIGVSVTNLGMIASLQGRHEDARIQFEEAIRLHREVGDPPAVAMCDNNLGNAYRDLGDYAAARRHYGDSLRTHREYDDKWALAFLLEDIGRLNALTGEPELALELLGAADALREEIGVPRGSALEQEIEEAIEPAASRLTAEERESAQTRGRSYDRDGAIDAALSPD